MMGNVLALYTHLHFSSQPQIAKGLLAAARRSSLFQDGGLLRGIER